LVIDSGEARQKKKAPATVKAVMMDMPRAFSTRYHAGGQSNISSSAVSWTSTSGSPGALNMLVERLSAVVMVL